MHRASRRMFSIVLASAAVAGVAVSGAADERKFAYTYETTVMPVGAWEYETWATWKTDKDTDGDFDRIDFRHELEFGVTENFQLAFYLSDWRYEDGESVEDDGADWKNVAVEAVYALTNPSTDWLGSALYGEVKFGDEVVALESKLLLQKNIGPWMFAYNLKAEAEWEGSDYSEDKGEFGNILGASYQFSPSFSLGAELVHEVEYEDWSQWGDDVVYFGPAFSVAAKRGWMVMSPLWQVTNEESEPNFQVRLIVAIDF